MMIHALSYPIPITPSITTIMTAPMIPPTIARTLLVVPAV